MRLTPPGVICYAQGDIALLTECGLVALWAINIALLRSAAASFCALSPQNRDREYASRGPFNYTRARQLFAP